MFSGFIFFRLATLHTHISTKQRRILWRVFGDLVSVRPTEKFSVDSYITNILINRKYLLKHSCFC